jgi:hypothetical protein
MFIVCLQGFSTLASTLRFGEFPSKLRPLPFRSMTPKQRSRGVQITRKVLIHEGAGEGAEVLPKGVFQ